MTDPELSQNDTFQDSKNTLENVKTACLALLDHYESLATGADNDSNTQNKDTYLAELRKKIYVNTIRLRELNWEAQNITNQAKARTSSEKDEVDQIQLDIQNIYYQHKHLKSEIGRCRDFRSKHESLDLIPLEELYQQDPKLQEIKDDHLLMIARLQDEEKRRLELFVTKTKLVEKKNKLLAENKQRKEDLEKLDSSIKSFVESADPILKQLEKY